MRPARASAGSTSTILRPRRQRDVDAAVGGPAALVLAGCVARAAGRLAALTVRDAEVFEVGLDRARTAGAEAEVVLLGAARIGATGELELLALQRAGRHARRDLLEHVAVVLLELGSVEVELRRGLGVAELELALLHQIVPNRHIRARRFRGRGGRGLRSGRFC